MFTDCVFPSVCFISETSQSSFKLILVGAGWMSYSQIAHHYEAMLHVSNSLVASNKILEFLKFTYHEPSPNTKE